jgi:hypothetical protein
MFHEIYDVCKYCLFNGMYLFYGVFVLIVSVYASHRKLAVASLSQNDKAALPPIPGGELPYPNLKLPQTSVATNAFALALELASFSFFVRIIHSGLQFIRTVFLMSDNPSPLRSFWRYFNIYYLIVVLPAAFMPPVMDRQRPPDFDLLAALVLMICANALGDLISVRIVLRILKKAEPLASATGSQKEMHMAVKNETKYYLLIIFAGICSLAVLIALLMCLSVLYGVQVGQVNFGLSLDFLREAWDRVIRFPEIASKPYWFRGQQGPFGLAGIPGLFIYGLTTFLPVLILSFLAAIWLLLIPFRLAVNLPSTTSPVVRVIAAESAVFGLCISISFLLRRFEIL